ncbi:MAG: SIR2 family protein [Deltaproteobacteria bacterium]|nr:SIR2 family protein [Deltaproteobacteria bacterium]
MEASWKNKHLLKVQDDREPNIVKDPDITKYRQRVEPWLTALFQSDHFSLLVGSGLSLAVHALATGSSGDGMGKITFTIFKEQMDSCVAEAAKKAGRGDGNIEDQIRVASDLLQGLAIYISSNVSDAKEIKEKLEKFKEEINSGMFEFAKRLLKTENDIVKATDFKAAEYLLNFMVSFASRSGTRERLNIFTTNYDRIVEFGSELAGIRLLDRFVGTVNPIFRSSRLEIDMHYNPPGIRGEPRYLEGVVHFTKLHGSVDWIYQNGNVRRISVPFGADTVESYLTLLDGEKPNARSLMIYPNASKDRETSEYPYVELFRDLASAICRPNSTLVLYGYGFGDEHLNRVIKDMLTIPSSHLVIISYSDEGDRIKRFYEEAKRPAQMSLMIGDHFGDLKTIVDGYLPKPAIDRATFRMVELLKSRGLIAEESKKRDDKK